MNPLRSDVLLQVAVIAAVALSFVHSARKSGSAEQNLAEGKKYKHPCESVQCSAGTECVVKPDRTAVCDCVKECRPETDDRKKVCSNQNVTFDSMCHLHQMACFCRQGMDACEKQEYEHLHVDYFGSCRQIGECKDEEKKDFPRRMREWLFNIMRDLARRKALDPEFAKLEKQAEHTQARQWVNAVIWKFCDLDIEPTNRVVSRHELYPLKAPLLAMEHCIAPFLDSCDADDDHQVTLSEWGTCLGLEVTEIQDKCHQMHKGKNF